MIGGGFYGATVASYLAGRRGLERVLIVERENALLSRASFTNQARVHSGYHYPRSFTTAFRSRVNLPRFLSDFPEAVVRDVTTAYAIARDASRVTARQFERFCREIEAPLELAPASLTGLFDRRRIEAVYLVEEQVFDASVLRRLLAQELERCGVRVMLGWEARRISAAGRGLLAVECAGAATGATRVELARHVFNCSYSGIGQLAGDAPAAPAGVKHEIAEMALMRVPPALAGLGVTVMDGPFFSLMPFPTHGLHTLSHVRYTPHLYWEDRPGTSPYDALAAYHKETRVDRMVRDVARYMPAILEAEYVESLFEVKTVLVKNEVDDGRPILFRRGEPLPGCFSILGGKIDNIYDVLERLDLEPLAGARGASLEWEDERTT